MSLALVIASSSPLFAKGQQCGQPSGGGQQVANPIQAEGGKVRGGDSVGPAYQLGDCPFIG